MRDVLPDIERWQAEGKQVALATVVKVYGSAPRPLGSKMAVSSLGEMSGSVSAGCVEGAVVEEALAALKSRQPKLLEYGIADELAFSVGLTCGGRIDIFVEPLIEKNQQWVNPGLYTPLIEAVHAEKLAALATVLNGPHMGSKLLLHSDGSSLGSLGDPQLDQEIRAKMSELMPGQEPQRIPAQYGAETVEVFIDFYRPLPRLVIVGAVHIAIPLVTFGKMLGFHTIVIDPRAGFATHERFPHVDELIQRWPDEALRDLKIDPSTFVVTLSHDAKLDNPALEVALKSPARYIGSLGSRQTHAKRTAALKESGFSDEQIAQIHAPIGLKIGARGAEEIALSIISEITAVNHGIGWS